MRRQAAEIMLESAKSGALAMAVQKSKTTTCLSDLDQVQEKAVTALVNSLDSGQLKSVLASLQSNEEPEMTRQAAAIMLEAAQSGALAMAIQQSKTTTCLSDLAQVQEKAVGALVNGLDSGQLKSILQEASLQSKEESEMRRQAAEIMLAAAQSGDFAMAIQQSMTACLSDLAQVQEKAVSALVNGLNSGQLKSALQEASLQSNEVAKDELEKTLLMARSMLTTAAINGSLGEKIAAVKAPKRGGLASQEDVRNRAAAGLIQALDSGDLDRVIGNLSTQGDRASVKEDLRLQARNLLAASSINGELQQAIETLKGNDSDIQDARSTAAKALQDSLETGALARALSDAVGPEQVVAAA